MIARRFLVPAALLLAVLPGDAATDSLPQAKPTMGGSGKIHVCRHSTNRQTCDTRSIAEALRRVPNGGIVTIGPGTYNEGGVLEADGVTIAGRKGTRLVGALAENKASLVIRGDNTTVIGLECSGVRNDDENGACIRINGRNLTVRNVYFHDSQQGILGGKRTGNILIENSRFERLGYKGYAHGIYIGDTESLVVRSSVFLRAKSRGHEIKSRAARTLIENSLVASLDGNDSRLIDVPKGGEVIIRNNVLEMGPNSVNQQAIAVGLEIPKSGGHPRNSVLIEGNVIVLERNGVNELIRFEGVPKPVIRGNTIVGGDGKVPPGNLWYPDRAAARLQPYPSLRIPRSVLPKPAASTN